MLKIIFLFVLLMSNFLYSQDNLPHVKAEILAMVSSEASIEKIIFDNGSLQLSIKQCISKTSGIYLLSFDSLLNENEVLKKINATRGILLAQFNHYTQSRGFPDDIQFPNQYALHNIGQAGGTLDADIDAPEAWDITTGGVTKTGDSIVIAIIDDGFQLSHPDLNFWKNSFEIAANGIDDDGNGFIDDTNGWNASSHTNSFYVSQHGTHIAGIAGSRGNNTLGVSGVMWNVKLMPVIGSTFLESVAVEAYSYVLACRRLYNQTNGAKGAFVVATNSSFGVDLGQPANFPIWCAMYDSLGKQGILSACATTNNNWNIDVVGDIPTACTSPYMISVAGTNRNDVRIASGYGVVSIDVAAPGAAILSTYPTNTYASLTGTSMASPHVAGVVGLMYAAACDSFMVKYKLHPDSFALLIKNYILTHVDFKQGFDTSYFSKGRLNAYFPIVALQTAWNCNLISLNELNTTENILVAPNPTSTNFTITNLYNATLISLKVIDITGRIIYSTTSNTTLNNLEIDASQWASGMYYIEIVEKNNFPITKKIIKVGW